MQEDDHTHSSVHLLIKLTIVVVHHHEHLIIVTHFLLSFSNPMPSECESHTLPRTVVGGGRISDE